MTRLFLGITFLLLFIITPLRASNFVGCYKTDQGYLVWMSYLIENGQETEFYELWLPSGLITAGGSKFKPRFGAGYLEQDRLIINGEWSSCGFPVQARISKVAPNVPSDHRKRMILTIPGHVRFDDCASHGTRDLVYNLNLFSPMENCSSLSP